jgi:hypothetical protein
MNRFSARASEDRKLVLRVLDNPPSRSAFQLIIEQLATA